MLAKHQVFIGLIEEIKKKDFLKITVNYKQQPTSIIVFSFDNQFYAYVNRCMHMQQPLDCQENAIFDDKKRLLRCSMHGFVFEPTSGECLSPVCANQHLQRIKLIVDNGAVYFSDKHVSQKNEVKTEST